MSGFIQAYKEAFQRCYPHHTISVHPVRVRQEMKYNIKINGSMVGDYPLSETDMREATRLFNRGR